MYEKVVRLSIGKTFSEFVPYSINFSQLPNIVCAQNTIMYSPTQYNECRRKSANYKGFADFIVLDFDEGWNDEHEQLFNKYIGYKVPTKSHMKEKNGIICERYRIILLLNTPINLDYSSYKRLYKHIMRDLNLLSDTSCVDATRFYYSAPHPVESCVRLKGTEYFPWEKYNYRDLQYASLNSSEHIDISAFKDIDISYLKDLQHSKRYPCPICRLEGYDQKGHHLAYNKDEDYPTCFFDEEHSKILRKIYRQYKYGTIEDKMESINDMVRMKCTPDLIKTIQHVPKPTNYSDNVHKLYDQMLDMMEKDDKIDLDIETFSEYDVSETLEEAEERLSANYKYIKGAYYARCDEYKGVALDPFKNKIRIVTISAGGARCPFDMYWVTDEQKQRVLNLIRDKLVIGHNLKFDLLSIMVKYGKEYCPKYCFDTMIASRMIHMALDPEEQQIGHNLNATAFRFLNYKMNKSIEHNWGKDNLTPRDYEYATDDANVLRPIFNEQVRQFKEIYGPFDTEHYDVEKLRFLGPLVDEHPILALEMQTLLEVIRIEFAGVNPNIPMMEKKIAEYDRMIEETDAELGINCGSSKQCIEYLKKYIDENIESSNSATLWEFHEDPRVMKMIDAKAARTRRGLMESMSITNVHPYDGRIHPHFNQLLNTGRFACSKPNMQQIPKDIKNDIYMSDLDGVAFDTDYAAVELRLATVVSGDPVMLEAYKKNTDMHYLTASNLFNRKIPKTIEEKEDAEKNENSEFVAKWQRGFAKGCNFGLIYGLHWTSFVDMNRGTGMFTDQELKDKYDKFFETYPGLDAMIRNAKNTFMMGSDLHITRWVAYKNGVMKRMDNKQVPFFAQCKTLLGRRLAVDTERKLMNYPVQGSGADAIKIAICYMGYHTRKDETTYKTINLVHDDTIGESKFFDFDKNSKYFRDGLEFAINYILRYQFHTPVDQDFCVLSLFGEEVFLEQALTRKGIEEKLIEKMKHDYDRMQKSDDKEEIENYVKELNKCNRLLNRVKEENKRLDEQLQIA